MAKVAKQRRAPKTFVPDGVLPLDELKKQTARGKQIADALSKKFPGGPHEAQAYYKKHGR